MAAAVCRLFDDVKLDIGPPTDNGFYYDFDLPHRLTPEDFEAIEQKMAEIIKEDHPFECTEMTRSEAEAFLKESGQPFKVERLADIPEDEKITFYRCGEFVDLCRGPHVESTGQIPAFKVTSVAGSYYRGIETNPMLQRLYGIAAINPKQLKVQIKQMEEAKKRDHRRIGKELDLFSIQEEVGPGLIHWHPKGARIRTVIEDFWRREHFRDGYEMLFTPHVGRGALWETSGHLGFYKENMYAEMLVDDKDYYVKPMNCPFHVMVYKSQKRSYRELPLKYAELGTVYRYEKTGVLHGLMRVRGFTQDDAHIFCTTDNVEQVIRETVQFALRIWRLFGFSEFTAYLATRPEKSVGEQDRWDQATHSLKSALEAEGIEYDVDDGGGAFYGPKIDLKIKDAIGREWQMSTIQFDFNLADRFDLSYVGADGQMHRPYMVHRALFGSLERFFGVLIEHYAGAFPLWLAPEQVRVLPLTDDQMDAACDLVAELKKKDVRVGIESRNDKIGAKIRTAQLEKIPYMLILGARELEEGKVAVRSRVDGDLGAMTLEEFLSRFDSELSETVDVD
jgi:threonyl-tRNA synthetase